MFWFSILLTPLSYFSIDSEIVLFCNLLLYNTSLQNLVAANKNNHVLAHKFTIGAEFGRVGSSQAHEALQPNWSGSYVSKMAHLHGCQVGGIVNWMFIWGCWREATPWGWLGFLIIGWRSFKSKCFKRPKWKLQEFLWISLRSPRIFLWSILWSSKSPRQIQIQEDDCHLSIEKEQKFQTHVNLS